MLNQLTITLDSIHPDALPDFLRDLAQHVALMPNLDTGAIGGHKGVRFSIATKGSRERAAFLDSAGVKTLWPSIQPSADA